MGYILDTNALIFYLYDPEQLSKTVADIVHNENNQIYVSILPQIHGDPFDRLIISQALTENLIIVTRDSIIPKYDVNTIW